MTVLKIPDGPFWRTVACGDFYYTDTFGTPGALGPPWFAPGGGPADFTVSGGSASYNGTGSFLGLVDAGAESADVTVDLTSTSTALSGAHNVGAVWNFRDTANVHLLEVNGLALAIYKISGGSVGVVHTETGTGNYGSGLYRIDHHVDGTLTLYRNGISIWTGTSALHSQAPYAGIYGDDPAQSINEVTIHGHRPLLRAIHGTDTWIQACPGEVGHPLKAPVGGVWTQIGCMRQIAGPAVEYDTGVYDTAVYG